MPPGVGTNYSNDYRVGSQKTSLTMGHVKMKRDSSHPPDVRFFWIQLMFLLEPSMTLPPCRPDPARVRHV